MSASNLQFSVATHVMAALAYGSEHQTTTARLTESVNAEPTFIRRTVSKLAKAGLIKTQRGRTGTCELSRPADKITLLDIYRASAAPMTCALHKYPLQEECIVSVNMRGCLAEVLMDAQAGFEERLARQKLSDFVGTLKKEPA